MLLVAVALVGALLAGVIAFNTLESGPDVPSASCAALSITWNDIPRQQSGFGYVCGSGGVSDGRLTMTLNNYHFADGHTINWVCPSTSLNGSSPCTSSGVYLLANVTVKNIGQGNTSIGPTLYASVNSSTSQPIGNGEYAANATFAQLNPNESIPAVNGGVFLPPGAKVTYWFIFYIPNVVMSDVPNLKLFWLSLVELEYGGTWDGGSFSCVPVQCQNPMTELVVLAS